MAAGGRSGTPWHGGQALDAGAAHQPLEPGTAHMPTVPPQDRMDRSLSIPRDAVSLSIKYLLSLRGPQRHRLFALIALELLGHPLHRPAKFQSARQ